MNHIERIEMSETGGRELLPAFDFVDAKEILDLDACRGTAIEMIDKLADAKDQVKLRLLMMHIHKRYSVLGLGDDIGGIA